MTVKLNLIIGVITYGKDGEDLLHNAINMVADSYPTEDEHEELRMWINNTYIDVIADEIFYIYDPTEDYFIFDSTGASYG